MRERPYVFWIVWLRRGLPSVFLLIIGIAAVVGGVQTWVQAARINAFFVNAMHRGMNDGSLDTLAIAAPLSQERLYWQLGLQALARGDAARAAGVLEDGLRRSPDHKIMRGMLGEAYSAIGDRAAAMREWERAGASVALYEKGQDALEAERFREAIEFLESSLRANPNHPTQPHAHYLLAYAYHRLGDAGRAIAEAQEAVRLDGGRNPGYRSMLAWIYEMTGHPHLAYQEYIIILACSPGYQQARDGLIRVEKTLEEDQK